MTTIDINAHNAVPTVDVSANQWLGLTPQAVVAATLNLDRATVDALRTDMPIIMPNGK